MDDPDYLESAAGRRLAFRHRRGEGPTIVFLSGYGSDMTGTKAVTLEAWAKSQGRAYLRFAVADRPGVLAEITAAMRDAGVSIESMIQRGAAADGSVLLAFDALGIPVSDAMVEQLAQTAPQAAFFNTAS